MTDTTSIDFGCPASGCYKSHTAIVKTAGTDQATTTCASCGNNILVKTRNANIVTVKVM